MNVQKEKSFISPDAGSSLEKPEGYFHTVREDVISLIPFGVKKVLEVGCAAGATAKKIKELGVSFVAGIEKDEKAGKEAGKHLDAVQIGDVETISISYPEKEFDCIICADVLEHLINPSQVLQKLKKYLHDDGTIIASIPNVKYYMTIQNLVEGNWTYTKNGIMDETHLRFFTLGEIKKLFRNSGFEILEIQANTNSQLNNFSSQKKDQLKFGRVLIQGLKEEEFNEFFIYQYQIVAKKLLIKTEDLLDKLTFPSQHIHHPCST